VALKKDGADQPDRLREKFSIMCAKDEKLVLRRIRRKVNWIGHTLRRHCRLERVMEGKMGGRSDGKTRKKT
jgi:hypothetical protein